MQSRSGRRDRSTTGGLGGDDVFRRAGVVQKERESPLIHASKAVTPTGREPSAVKDELCTTMTDVPSVLFEVETVEAKVPEAPWVLGMQCS